MIWGGDKSASPIAEVKGTQFLQHGSTDSSTSKQQGFDFFVGFVLFFFLPAWELELHLKRHHQL